MDTEIRIRNVLHFKEQQRLSERCVVPIESVTNVQTMFGLKKQQQPSDRQATLVENGMHIRAMSEAQEQEERGKFLASLRSSTEVVEVSTSACRLTGSALLAYGKCPSFGKLLICGRRREMEDSVAIVPSFITLSPEKTDGQYDEGSARMQPGPELHFFGIYDGHGGSQASLYCMHELHVLLAEELRDDFFGGTVIESADACQAEWERVMKACYTKMDKEVGGVCPSGVCEDDLTQSMCISCGNAIAPGNVGTTALVTVIGPSHIIVANCGDSRAVLFRGGNVVPLSRDHKPERVDETSRIEDAGGRIFYWEGYRVEGLLALSRAIGDRYLKRYIISEPEVMCMERSEDDEFLILASDGLWDVVSNDCACEVTRKSLMFARRKLEITVLPSCMEDPASVMAARLLVKLAFNKGSRDNISVVVVDLKAK